MTQNEQILSYLRKGNSITALECLLAFGCLRLAARIKDLRESGHRIETTLITDGGKRFAKYRLSAKH